MYSNGKSEQIIGNALRKLEIPRHKVVIMTKCHFVVNEHDGTNPQPQNRLYKSKDYINQFGMWSGAYYVQFILDQSSSKYI